MRRRSTVIYSADISEKINSSFFSRDFRIFLRIKLLHATWECCIICIKQLADPWDTGMPTWEIAWTNNYITLPVFLVNDLLIICQSKR